MFSRSSVLFLALGALMVAAAHSQNTPPNSSASSVPTFKTETRLVVVDVVVTSGKGDPVTGLKKDAFKIFEDDKQQTVSVFDEHRGAPPTQIKLPPMPPNVYTNFPTIQSADSVSVLLLDALNTPAADQSYVHAQMIKYLKTIAPQTRVAVFTLSSQLRMLQGVTTDSAQLLAVVDSAKTNPSQSPLRASEVEKDADQSRVDFLTAESMAPPRPPGELPAENNLPDPIAATQQFLSDTAFFQTEMRIRMTLEAMQQLGHYLADIPGRKNVIWFSGSFPAAIVPDSDLSDPFSGAANFQEETRRTTDLLTTAQVALYPIAAEGLITQTAFQVDNRQIGQKRISLAAQDRMQQSHAEDRDLVNSHASMEQLAKDTGGQAFYNTNGLSDALTRVVNNGSRYYTLAYAPTNTAMDGKYRHILVKLVGDKGSLAYRRGYYADDLRTVLASQKQNSDPLLRLMGRNLPDYSQILYKIMVKPTDPQPSPDTPRIGSNTDMKGPFKRYGIDFAVSPSDLRLEPDADGARHGNIELMLVAYDKEGKPLNLVMSRSEIKISAKDFSRVQKGGLQIHKEIDVPQGYTFLRTGIYDLKSASVGTLGISLAAVAASPAR